MKRSNLKYSFHDFNAKHTPSATLEYEQCNILHRTKQYKYFTSSLITEIQIDPRPLSSPMVLSHTNLFLIQFIWLCILWHILCQWNYNIDSPNTFSLIQIWLGYPVLAYFFRIKQSKHRTTVGLTEQGSN